jgi:hypothetical protein
VDGRRSKQPDGVVLFEAHISAQYLRSHRRGAQALAGTPIKALVMT